jgi:transcriptional regulator with XRE-family HTH domain
MSKLRQPNEKLQHQRELRGWSQRKVAEELDTTEKRVSAWECGDSTPSPYFREKLCILFGKNAEELGFLNAPAPEIIHLHTAYIPRGCTYRETAEDRLIIGGRLIKWIVLERARYSPDQIQCIYNPIHVPLIADFERMLQDYGSEWERRRQQGETDLPYNSGMYKLNRFQVGYRQLIDGEEVSQLRLEFGPTDYFTQIITDLNVENPIRRRYAAKASLAEQPVPEFASLLGVNLNLITSDHLLLVTERSSRAFIAGGSFHTSVAENLLRPKDALPDGVPNPFAAAARGALEEIGIALQPEDISFSTFGVDPQLCQYSLIGTIWLHQTGAEIERLRQMGIPKDKWESRQFNFVPFDLESVANFVVDHWDHWFSIGLAAVVMSLLDAGYESSEIDAAFSLS